MCCVEIYTTSSMEQTFQTERHSIIVVYAKEMNARILPPIN